MIVEPVNFAGSLAAGFISPALAIAGLFLAGIPIIIHLLNRRRYKTHRWAAMDYLLEALRRNRRRLQFEHWVLMTLRCLAMLLAAVALARPIGCSTHAAGRLLGQQNRLNVIVIDNSASMAWQRTSGSSRTNFERARALAGQMLDTFSSSHDAVSIITTTDDGSSAGSTATYDLHAAREALRLLGQNYTPGNLAQSLRQAIDVALESGSFPTRRLYILSDSTRQAWLDPYLAPTLGELSPKLGELFEITHIDVANAEMPNVAVTDVYSLSNVLTTRIPVDFAAQARSFGGVEASLIWQIGTEIARASAAVDSESTEQILPRIAFSTPQPVAVVARLDPSDRLSEDDQRCLAAIVRRQVNVLIAEGDRGRGPLQSAGSFLQLALAPTEEPADGAAAPPASVQLISEADLAFHPLGECDAVILASPSQLGQRESSQLRAFVEDGGTLIIFMGEGVVPEAINQTLATHGLMPGKLISWVTAGEGQEPYRLDFRPSASVHPLLHVFRGEERSGLAAARVWTYGRLEVDPRLNVERVLDFAGGDPAITLHALGRGKVLFIATSAGTNWTTLPAKPAFVALVNEIVLGTVDPRHNWLNIPAGSRLNIPRHIAGSHVPQLTDPHGRQLTLDAADADHPENAFSSEPLVTPGLYRLQLDGQTFPVSVRFPSAESDLTRIPPAAIRQALGEIEIQHAADTLPQSLVSAGDQADFGWPIMLLVMVILGTEAVLAMRFRH